MYCIINLCQACEAFFMKGIEIKLLWEPWKEKIFERSTDILNCYSYKLHKKIKDYTYSKLRNAFFDLYLYNKSFHSQTEIDNYINAIDCFAKIEPADKDIQKYRDSKTQDLFLDLKKLKIGKMRNKVVHKYGFRPNIKDVKKYLEEVSNVVFGLQTKLKIDEIQDEALFGRCNSGFE